MMNDDDNKILFYISCLICFGNLQQVEKAESDAQSKSGKPYELKPLGLKWVHPISVTETGCVLVAT